MDGQRMQKTAAKQPARSASERSLPLSSIRGAPSNGSASCSSLPPILEPAAIGQVSARSHNGTIVSPRPVSSPGSPGALAGLSSPRPAPSLRPGVHDLAHISLDGLWLLMLSEHRTLAQALDAAGLANCEAFDEVNTRILVANTVGELRADECTAVLLRAMRKPGGAHVATRDCLLSTLGSIPPRQRFRDWANTMLLLFSNLVEMGSIFASGARPNGFHSAHWKRPARAWEKTGHFPVDGKAFREALMMFDVNVNDANMWFDRLAHRDCWPQEDLDFGVLVRRIVSQPWLEGDKDLVNGVGVGEALAQEDIVVRLLHAWGDLSSAFQLKPASEKHFGPRPANGAERISNYSAHRLVAQEESRPPPASPPTLEQWTRALRGANKTRLLAETEAKAEASRQVSLQRESLRLALQERRIGAYSHSYLASSFPNLSEHLLLSRCNFFPQELIVVCYSLADHGFLGPAIMPYSRRGQFGTHPVVAIVPLGKEEKTYDACSPRRLPTEPHFNAPCDANVRIGRVHFRAPCHTDSGGEGGLYAVQLYASEDGRTLRNPIGSPVPLRVVPRPPLVPSRPILTAKLGKSLTFTWADPVDDGGAPLKGHILGLWKSGPRSSLEFPPDRICEGEDIRPGYEVQGLLPETEYISRVRCVSDGGVSDWSEASAIVSTMAPEPGDLGPPQINELVKPEAVTMTWAPHDFRVDCYEVQVTPCDGSEAWIVKVSPPPPARRATSPILRKRELGESPSKGSPRRRTNSINGTSGVWTKVTIDGLLTNTRYRFAVRAINASGIGPWSEQSAETLTGPGIPSKPGAPVQTAREKNSITLSWNPPLNDGGSPVVRYHITGREERHGRGSPRGTPLGSLDTNFSTYSPKSPKQIEFSTVDASTTFVVRKLRGNTRYVFRVYALNSAGLSLASDPSESACSAPTEPEAPAQLRVTDTKQKDVELRWNPPSNDGGAPILHYHIEVCQRNQDVDPYKFKQDALGVLLSDLHGNLFYNVRVCAENSVGRSPFAELVVRTGAVSPGPPGAPRCLGEALSTTATVAWSPPTDDGGDEILGYTLRGYAYSGPNHEDSHYATFSVDTVLPRALVEGLTPSAYYRFRVQAKNSCGLGVSSKWSPLVMTAPPPPPTPGTPFVLSATSQTIEVSWDAPGACDESDDIAKDVAPVDFEVAISRHRSEDDDAPLSPGPPEKLMKVQVPRAQFRCLQMFSTYSFRVRARGRGGYSDWSMRSPPQQTTDEWSKEEIIGFLMERCGYTLAGVFRSFDRDCDSFISQHDFLDGLDRLGLQQVSEDQKLELFYEADEVSRGVITLREFTKCFGPAAAAAAAATRRQDRQGGSKSRSCLMSPVEDPQAQACSPAPSTRTSLAASSPSQHQRRTLPTTSPSPYRSGNGGRNMVTRRSTSPPVPKSLSPQVPHRRSLRSASTKALLHSPPAKADDSIVPPIDEICSGTGDNTPPPPYDHELAVLLSSCGGDAPVRATAERTRTIDRMKSAPGPSQRNRGQRLVFPR